MYYIGVDIGGTGVQAGVVAENGQILFRKECPTDVLSGFEKIMEDINQLVRTMLKENGVQISEIKSIGFGVPSFINKKGQVTCVNLGWKEEDFINTLKAKFPETNVYAENDATVAALAEAKAGSMKGCDVGVMYTLGTGVGGGIIIGGKIFPGFYPGGAEVGHQIIEVNGRECGCGKKGCFEAYSSASALILAAKKKAEENKDSLLYKLVEGDVEKMNAKIPFDAAQSGDQ